jgi:sulfatase maturation enzyme AslB (radical SAM superfamily)
MNICYDAFKSINIVLKNNQLSISPCCISPTAQVESLDFENNIYLNQIRKEWNQGVFPTACNNCKQAEDVQMISRRQGSTTWYQDHNGDNTKVELIRMDYWTGDLCNLACVICGPHNSSVWKQELGFPIQRSRVTVNQFWKSMDLTKLEFVHFNGGEPLLSKEHVKFLESIPDKSRVHLNYNTNATVLPNQYLLDLWEKFQLVQLDFSIDDIEERFEYQRYPAKWNIVVDNLQWFVDNAPHNFMFAVNTSVGILNQANISNLNTWLKQNFHTSRFTDPIEHRQQLTHGMFALNAPKDRAIKFLDDCDARRGTNWQATFPELINLQ